MIALIMELKLPEGIGKRAAAFVIAVSLCFGITACASMDHEQSPDGYDANLDPEK